MNICVFCSEPTANPKFCNNSCSAKFSNVNRAEKRYCLHCKKSLHWKQNIYCSVKCQQNKIWEERKLEIESLGISPSDKASKRYLTDKSGHQCSICKITNWLDKPLIMILDHIDGNSTNNYLSNLRLVCSNCDSQLPTYKARNTGKGRFSRRQRYSEGKSY